MENFHYKYFLLITIHKDDKDKIITKKHFPNNFELMKYKACLSFVFHQFEIIWEMFLSYNLIFIIQIFR